MKKYILHTLTLILLSACSGDIDFLDERPDKSRLVPESLDDLQNLLDYSGTMNVTPALGLLGSDDLYTNEQGFNSYRHVFLRNAYIWNPVIFEGDYCADWIAPYRQIFYSNVVLARLGKGEEDTERSRQLRGAALFYRAHAYFQLLQIFAPSYNPDKSENLLGVPLQLTSKVTENANRATLQECYDRVISDLIESVSLLVDYDPIKTRPCSYTAYALLSRTFLLMGEYEKALEWADKVLEGPYVLQKYELVDSSETYPFPQYNTEVILHTELLSIGFYGYPWTLIDSSFVDSYKNGDKRHSLYFIDRSMGWNFRGNYTGNYQGFTGLSLDEVLLTKAECLIRTGDIRKGMNVLNDLLMTRWEEGTFIPFEANTEDGALDIVLEERRKSLLFRGINWMDLRRLNTDPRFARTLRRTIDGQTYELPPGDQRYIYPIPDDEMRLNPLIQNER